MIERRFGIEIDPTFETTSGGAPKTGHLMDQRLYLHGVRGALAQILDSHAGRDLAAALRYHGKKILLVQYTGGDCNAQEWWWGASEKDNHSMVRFTPTLGRSPCAEEVRKKRPASLPHEVLFHELVHSLRRVSGKRQGASLKGSALAGHGNQEEFIAVLVTNIFISDFTNRSKSGLREEWTGHAPLDAALAESYRYFQLGTKAYNLIANFCEDNPGFTKMLSKVRARFNPLAAFYQNQHKAFEMAARGDAERTFGHMTPMDYVENPSGAWVRIIPRSGPPARN